MKKKKKHTHTQIFVIYNTDIWPILIYYALSRAFFILIHKELHY